MKSQKLWLAGISLAAVAGFAAMANAQGKTAGPVATYVMTASTDAGMSGGAASMMSAMMGGGSSATRRLNLYLGSTRKAPGEAKADHIPPAALKAGAALPLLSGPPKTEGRSGVKLPSGKVRVYWGCGEKAAAGQPVLLDVGKMATNEAPASFGGLIFKRASLPSPAGSATYGAWPNQKTSRGIPGDASLVGEHVVRGNYTPEIRFSLNQSQNFMPALNVTRNSRLPSGAVQLAWQPIANARAYFGFSVGEAKDGTVILWTSSNAKTFIGSAGDFMDASEINRLLGQKALLTPQQTQCAVPAEVVRAVGENGMFHFTAYGPEANFSYPPKPSGNAPWNVEWTTKLLTKSAYVGILGMSMSDMMSDDTDEDEEEQPEKKKKGMGGFLKKVL